MEIEKDHCDTCGGMGFGIYDLPIENPLNGTTFPCPDCQGEIRMERLKKLSRLNTELMGCDLQSFLPRNHLGLMVSHVKNWMRVGQEWLTLSGPSGTGKTHLLAAIANVAVETGTPALYTSTADLLGDLQRTFNPKSDQVYSHLFAQVLDIDILLLDELEKWHGTPWAQSQMFRLFEHRLRNSRHLRTVLATNVDLRPLLAGKTVSVLRDPHYPGYLESRIAGGRVLAEFWLEEDFRPLLAAARHEETRQEARDSEPQAEQGELL